MESHEFNPPAAVIYIDDLEVELKPFSLMEKGWVLHEFATEKERNGLTNLAAALESLDMLTVARFAWRLVSDKGAISKDKFFTHCEDKRNLVKVYEALNKTIRNGESAQRAGKKLAELKKS